MSGAALMSTADEWSGFNEWVEQMLMLSGVAFMLILKTSQSLKRLFSLFTRSASPL